jgi:hypothetical protein
MSERHTKLKAKRVDTTSLRDLAVPAALKGTAFDEARAVSLTAAGERELTLIPPRGVFDQLKRDLGAALREPQPWLVLRRPGPGRPAGQNLVLEPTERTGMLKASLYRRSGRCVAEGTVTRDGNRGVRFSLHLLCVGGRGKFDAQIRGLLTTQGRWQVELVRSDA